MAVRPIDANAMLNELRPLGFEAEHSAVLLSDVSKMMREWVERQPTLTPPNEWMSRVQELDELYTKFQTVTGFTAEQLLEMFKAGYTLEKPDYSKYFEVMTNLAESGPPNEALTCEGCAMQGEKVTPCASCIRDPRVCDYYTCRPPAGGRGMKFKNWTPEELSEWARMLPSSQLMDCNNKIKIWGEIHVDNSEPKRPPEGEEDNNDGD